MKVYTFNLDQYQAKWAFSPIRSKQDILLLWMNTLKTMLAYVPIGDADAAGRLVLVVSKMSRVFFISSNKVFSITFPFFTNLTDDTFEFKTHACDQIDNRVTSEIISLIDAGVLSDGNIWSFVEPIEVACEIDENIWNLLRELMLCEDGYLRYDHDVDRANGHIHPLHHIDVFYANNSTFKIGLLTELSQVDLADLLDVTTACHYLQKSDAIS